MAVAVESIKPTERKYHATSSAYVLPNDAVEHDRLDAQASAIVEMIGGAPFLAPSKTTMKVSKILDVGCGTGVATIQAADLFPSAKVYGLDLSPVPAAARELAPRNTVWVTGNILDVNLDFDLNRPEGNAMDREIFAPANIDYAFGRMLFLGVNDWQRYFSILYHSMSSDSVIEHQDLDWKFYRAGTSQCLSDNWEWHRQVVQCVGDSGLSATAGSDAALIMRKLGFEVVDVQTFEFSFVPSSTTPNSQAMGRYVQAKLIPNYPELLRKMLAAKGFSSEEMERLVSQCLHDISSEEGIHQRYTVTIARKL